MGQRSLRDATLKIVDGGSSDIEIKIGEGNISWTESRNLEYTHDRGAVSEVRLGDDEPCEISFDFIWEWLSSISGATPYELIKGETGSTSGDACEPFAVNLVIEMHGCTGDAVIETITFTEFRFDTISADLRQGQLSCSGKIPASGPVITS